MSGPKFASGKKAISECDRCGFQYKLKELKKIVIKTKNINLLVCPTCWEPDQPQLQLGMYPVYDPQALQNPRKDTSYFQAGFNGTQVENINPPDPDATDAFGMSSGGSRIIQWGWNPVGGARDNGLTPNNLVAQGSVGTVTVTT
jgi:hypothetical protein